MQHRRRLWWRAAATNQNCKGVWSATATLADLLPPLDWLFLLRGRGVASLEAKRAIVFRGYVLVGAVGCGRGWKRRVKLHITKPGTLVYESGRFSHQGRSGAVAWDCRHALCARWKSFARTWHCVLPYFMYWVRLGIVGGGSLWWKNAVNCVFGLQFKTNNSGMKTYQCVSNKTSYYLCIWNF